MLRYGYMAYVCKQLTQSNAAMDFALIRVFAKNKVVVPNKNNIARAYSLFNPEKNIDAKGLLEQFELGSKSQKSIKDQWAEIFLVLCSDPSWQII